MSSLSAGSVVLARKRVDPAHLWIPERSDSLGDLAVSLVKVFGLDLDAEQALALDAILSVVSGPDGEERWAALEAALIESRQNGKSVGVLMPVALLVAISKPDQLVVWSAHRYKTAHEAFLAMLKLYRSSPELSRRISRVSFSNGEESFEFVNGSRIIFIARSQASGRGLSGDLVILDEALFLTAEMMGALLPTLSARPNPMVLYASSAGLAISLVLQLVRDRGREGGDPSLVYIEWCAPEGGCTSKDCDHHRNAVGCSLDNRKFWQQANPAMGKRITETYIAAERRSLPPAEFARERMGWWESSAIGGLFHMPAWWKLTDPDSTPGDRIVFGVHVTPDRAWSSVAVASLRGDGILHVELVAHDEGVAWVVPWVTDRVERHGASSVVLASSMAAGSLSTDFEDLPGFDAMTSTEVRRACAALFDAVNAGTLAHRGDADLGVSVQVARRSSGKGEWIFDADEGVDLSPLYAVALAAWAVRQPDDKAPQPSAFFFGQLGNCSDCECHFEFPADSAPCLDCGHQHSDDDEDG